MILYDREVGKENSAMSLREVEDFVRKNIMEYVLAKQESIATLSSLVLLVCLHFKLAQRAMFLKTIIKCCVQLGSYLRINQINGRDGDNLRSKFIALIAKAMNMGMNEAGEVVW